MMPMRELVSGTVLVASSDDAAPRWFDEAVVVMPKRNYFSKIEITRAT